MVYGLCCVWRPKLPRSGDAEDTLLTMHHPASLFIFVPLVGALVSRTKEWFFPRAVSMPAGVAGAILWAQGWLVGHCPVHVNLFLSKTRLMHQQCAMRTLVHSRQTVLWFEPKQSRAWCCQEDSVDNHDNMGNHGDAVFQMVPFLFSPLLQILSRCRGPSSLHSSGHSSADLWHFFLIAISLFPGKLKRNHCYWQH